MTTISRTRERINAEEVHDRPRQSKRSVPSTDNRFTVLPRAFISTPGRCGLSVYETGILCALIAGARQRDYADCKAIAEKAKAEMFAKRMKCRNRDMKQAGIDSRDAFRKSMREQRTEWAPPDTLSFKAYATELHVMAGLATSTASLAKLNDALAKMHREIVPGLPPLLVKATRLRSGRYRFVVNSAWLAKPHRRVNLPLPTTSANATNLFLFMRTQGGRPKSITEVCKAIGIKSRKPFERRRILKRAFDIANEMYISHHTSGISGVTASSRSEMPIVWKLHWVSNDRVQFWPGIPREED